MATTDSGTALEPIRDTYPVLAPGRAQDVIAAIAANLGGEKISETDLDRVKIPAGGGRAWEVPTLDGPETTSELVGIIVYAKNVRAYWPTAFDGGNEPPSCASADGEVGVGDPGGPCHLCAFSQFGSAVDRSGEPAAGQACQQRRQLFVLTAGSMLPLVVSLPPTSLAGARQYFLRLAGKGIQFKHAETKITLAKTRSAGGVDYSAAEFALGRVLDSSEREMVDEYATALAPKLAASNLAEQRG